MRLTGIINKTKYLTGELRRAKVRDGGRRACAPLFALADFRAGRFRFRDRKEARTARATIVTSKKVTT